MGEADGDFGNPQPLSATAGSAVEPRAGRAAAGADHLDITPPNAAKAGSERLHHRLFSRKSRRQIGRAATAVGDLPGSEDAPQEPLSVPVQDTGNAINLYEVNTGGEHE